MQNTLRAYSSAWISKFANTADSAVAISGVVLAVGALLVALVVSDDRVMDDSWTRLASPASAAATRDVERQFVGEHGPGSGDRPSVMSVSAPPGAD